MNTGITDLSPLDQIRLAEAEVARQLVAARQSAEVKLAKIRLHAEQIVCAARDAGRKEGEVHYKNIIVSAEEEAQTIISQAHQRVAELRRQGRQRMMGPLTRTVIDMVTGREGEARADEH